MVSSCVCVVVCVGLFLAIQTRIPRARALPRASDVDAYVVDARTDLRDYVVDARTELRDYVGLQDQPEPEPLPEFILDYANMIRNDIILLDNSVETRTRKRGNIKVKKHSNHIPCACERTYDLDDYRGDYVNLTKALGMAQWYPSEVLNVTCDENKCAKPYRCQKIMYNLTVLKRTSSAEERLGAGRLYSDMANELKYKWVPRRVPVVAACLCASAYPAN